MLQEGSTKYCTYGIRMHRNAGLSSNVFFLGWRIYSIESNARVQGKRTNHIMAMTCGGVLEVEGNTAQLVTGRGVTKVRG